MRSTSTAFRARHRTAGANARSGWVFWATLIPTMAAIAGFGGVYSYIWVPADVALFVALAVLYWRWALGGRELPRHILLVPMGAFGAVVLAQWGLKLSIYPGVTLTGLVQLAGDAAVFYLMLDACRSREAITQLGKILWIACGVLSAEAILQGFGANGYIYWFHDATYATPVGPFVYHNFYAGCMDLLLPAAVVYALREEPSLEPQWALWLRRGLVPALAVASIVVSRSRGGVLAVLAEAVLGVVVFWPDLKRKRRGIWGMAVGGVLIASFSLLANWGPMAVRFERLARYDPSALDRLAVATACWRIFLTRPWWGTGFGTFATAYPAFQTFDNGFIFQNAHNDYAQILAETGVLGAMCVLGFLVIWGRAFLRRRARNRGAGLVRNLQLAYFIGTAGFLLHSYGDFQFHAPGNALLFFVLTAAAVTLPATPASALKPASKAFESARVARANVAPGGRGAEGVMSTFGR